jgi:hypothetical protein
MFCQITRVSGLLEDRSEQRFWRNLLSKVQNGHIWTSAVLALRRKLVQDGEQCC